MDDLPSHQITMSISGNYPHSKESHISITVSGDGSIEQYVDTFKSFLVAAGYMKTAQKFNEVDIKG